jgi:ABC-type Zn uptake system ZnuABC Zn-binding protein ZnuA
MKKLLFFIAIFCFFCCGVDAKVLQIVTSTTDLADLVKSVGGDRVSVFSLTSGQYNLHQIEARPSMVLKVHHADAVFRIGMGLDSWMDSIIDASRNPKVRMGTPGYVDVSGPIRKLEVPKGRIDGAMGDIHVYGNPHYWLNPSNGIVMARVIKDALSRLSVEDSAYFNERYDQFSKKMRVEITKWGQDLSLYRGMKLISFHKSWPYLAQHFEFQIVGDIEPKPGIPPSPEHLLKVISLAKEERVSAIIAAPYDNIKACEKVASDAKIPLLIIPTSVGGNAFVRDYTDIFDYCVQQIKTKVVHR